MATNFDITFEKNKAEFKNKFGKEWKDDPKLYLEYIQAIYQAAMYDLINSGLAQILNHQKNTHELLQHMSQKIK